MQDNRSITAVKGSIHRDDEPRHFMTIEPAASPYRVHYQGSVLASSDEAQVLKEVGFGIYDPVLYFPRADVAMDRLTPTDHTTRCPLKGQTTYYAADGVALAWSYTTVLPYAAAIQDYIAFDGSQVEIERVRAS